tara:strand:+ start:756 stop:1184 length:429 start_codon:yes stop_codon:yes gene_type:complete
MKYSDLSEKTPFYILLLPWIVSLIIFSFIIAYLAILNDYDAKIIILCQLLVQYELIGNILRLYKNNSKRINNLKEIQLTDLKLKEMSGTNISSISQKFLDDSKWIIQYNKRIIRKFLLVLLVRVFSFTVLTMVFIKIFYFFL